MPLDTESGQGNRPRHASDASLSLGFRLLQSIDTLATGLDLFYDKNIFEVTQRNCVKAKTVPLETRIASVK